MPKDIELNSFKYKTIECYEPGDKQKINETCLNQNTKDRSKIIISDYNFFVQHDLRKAPKKKHKNKKKQRHSNLINIIYSELESISAPLNKNVIKMTNNQNGSADYLINTVGTNLISFRNDVENGWSFRSKTLKLAPTFSNVFDRGTSKIQTPSLEFIEPVNYNVWLTNIIETADKSPTFFLNIEIHALKFIYHHCFSLEKILTLKLIDYYNESQPIQATLKKVSKDIIVIRNTKENLKQELLKIISEKDDIRFDVTLRKYTKILLDLKKAYLDTLKKHRQITNKIISIWSDVQTIREKSKSITTPYYLKVKNNTLDNDLFVKEWTEKFSIEYTDMLNKIEYEYVSKYIAYKEAKRACSESNERSIIKIIKPKLCLDEDKLKEDVEALVNELTTKENIDIVLECDENLICESKSNFYIYYFKIYVDNMFVCESKHYSSSIYTLSNIDFNDFLSVEILPTNNTLTLALYENEEMLSYTNIDLDEIKSDRAKNDVTRKLLITDKLIEPTLGCIGSGYKIKEIALANKVRLKSSNVFKGNLYTQCEVLLKIKWNTELSQSHIEVIKNVLNKEQRLKRAISGVEKPSVEFLSEIISEVHENEVENENNLQKILSNLSKTTKHINKEFAVDINTSEYIRFKLLRLRNTGAFSGIQKKQIPLHTSQISTELNCLQKNNIDEFNILNLNEKYSEMDPIESKLLTGAKYIQKLNQNILRNINEQLLKKTYKDVVRDFKDLTLRTLFSKQASFSTLTELTSRNKHQLFNESLLKEQEIHITVLRAFNLQDRTKNLLSEENNTENENIAGIKVRPLRPFVRVSYRDVSSETATAVGCYPTWNQTLKINIKPQPLSSIHINIYDELKVKITDIHPEDEHSLHNKTMLYKCYNKWLGTVKIPLYTVLSSGTVRETFKITTPPIILGYENDHDNTNSDPFIGDVTRLMKKEAAFITLKITTSLAHLGMTKLYYQPIPDIENEYLIKHLNSFVSDYVNEFPSRNISLTFIDSFGTNKCVTQFLQPICLPDINSFPKTPKIRSDSAISKSSGLSKSSSSKGSSRKRESETDKESSVKIEDEKLSIYSGFDGDKKSEGVQLSKLMDWCARYVSLIPTYEVTDSHVVTLSGLELLKVTYGSPLDHTILLASYFLFIGLKAWIVTGMGIPCGQSSYVLTAYDQGSRRFLAHEDQLIRNRGIFNRSDGCTWFVYDAGSGERFELRDVSCPLKTIDYVFDNENIWVNIQSTQDCESVSFDFSRTSDWRQVFNKPVFVMKHPVVTDSSLYGPAPDVVRLCEALEAKIKSKIQKWRPHNKTIWNRYCSNLLRDVLPHWEHWSFNPMQPKPALGNRLKQLMVTYKIFGFPLNIPFLNTKSVTSTVKSTGIHCNDDPNVEFGLAVEVYGYPNNVLSIWVFLASISRI